MTFDERLAAAEAESERLDILVATLIDALRKHDQNLAAIYEREHEEERVRPETLRPVVDRPLAPWELPVRGGAGKTGAMVVTAGIAKLLNSLAVCSPVAHQKFVKYRRQYPSLLRGRAMVRPGAGGRRRGGPYRAGRERENRTLRECAGDPARSAWRSNSLRWPRRRWAAVLAPGRCKVWLRGIRIAGCWRTAKGPTGFRRPPAGSGSTIPTVSPSFTARSSSSRSARHAASCCAPASHCPRSAARPVGATWAIQRPMTGTICLESSAHKMPTI